MKSITFRIIDNLQDTTYTQYNPLDVFYTGLIFGDFTESTKDSTICNIYRYLQSINSSCNFQDPINMRPYKISQIIQDKVTYLVNHLEELYKLFEKSENYENS